MVIIMITSARKGSGLAVKPFKILIDNSLVKFLNDKNKLG